MAKYTYEQLKKDQNERQKLLNTLRGLREQKDVWDNVFPDEEDRHYRAAREKVTSLLNGIERMEGILGDTKNDRRADFDETMKELGDSMKSFRYDRIFGQGYDALRERVPGLDDIATGLGLAGFGTADDIAERYRYIANKDYDALSGEEEMECVTGFLALHEQVGNEKAPGEKRFDHTTFAQDYADPVYERLDRFSEQQFGRDYSWDEETFGRIRDAINKDRKFGAEVDRVVAEHQFERFQSNAERIRRRISEEGFSKDRDKAVEDIARLLTARKMAALPKDKRTRFDALEKAATEVRTKCLRDAKSVVKAVWPDQRMEFGKNILEDDGATLEKLVAEARKIEAAERSKKLGKIPLPEDIDPAPTAKERIEALQARIKKGSFKDEASKRRCVAEIIAARQTVGAKRGGVFGGDKRLNDRLNPDKYNERMEIARNTLAYMPEKTLAKLYKLAADGHGGEMLESFKKANTYAVQHDMIMDELGREEPEMDEELLEERALTGKEPGKQGPRLDVDVTDVAKVFTIYAMAKDRPDKSFNMATVEKAADTLRALPNFESFAKDEYTKELLESADVKRLTNWCHKFTDPSKYVEEKFEKIEEPEIKTEAPEAEMEGPKKDAPKTHRKI